MGLLSRIKQGIQIVVGGYSQGRTVVKGATWASGAMRPKQGEEWLHAYNTMPWLRANVSKIANGVSGLEWGITLTRDANGLTVKRPDIQKGTQEYRRKALAALEDEEKTEAIFDHPFLALWKNPCPALPGGAARKLAQVYYELVGEVFFLIDRGPREGWIKNADTGRPLPSALWPIPPHWIKRFPVPDNPTFEIRYGQLQLTDIPMSEVLWLKDPDPVNPYARGVGLFNSLSDELDSDENAARMISYSFYNRNRPDLLVTIPGATQPELDAFREQWVSNTQGVANALKNHFINTEAKVEQLGYDFREMQVINLRQHTRDTIRQVPGTPPEMLGIQDQSNRSTIDAAEYIFSKHVIEPRAEVWREFLQGQILCEYDDRAVLDYVSPVQEDKNFALSVATGRPEPFRQNEIRKLAGLPALTEEEGGNLFYVNGSFVPSLASAPGPAGPEGGMPPGAGGGLEVPGFEGGINVQPALPFHLSVPGAAGSAESGVPAAAPGMPPSSGAQALLGPGREETAQPRPDEFQIQGAPRKDAKEGVRKAARRFRGVSDARLTKDQAQVVARWAEMNGHALDLDLVSKTAPIPLSDKRPEEWARRANAYLEDLPTSGWDSMFGPWSDADTKIVDTLLMEKKEFDENQPRDERGRWTGEGGAGSAGGGSAQRPNTSRVDGDHSTTRLLHVPKIRAADLHSALKQHGGFTVNPRSGESPEEGFAVSLYKGREAKFEGHATPTEIAAYARDNADLLGKEGVHIGGWYNEEDKHTYLDPSHVVSDQREANKLAWKNNQIAYFDLKTKTEHKTVHPAEYDLMRYERGGGVIPDYEPPKKGESQKEGIDRRRRNEARRMRDEKAQKYTARTHKAPRVIDVVVKHLAGTEFDHDQSEHAHGGSGEGGGGEAPERGPVEGPAKEVQVYENEPKTPVPNPPPFDPDVEHDANGDGVTDSARVGVPADEVPPPPTVPRLANLTPEERKVESEFAEAYEANPDKMARDFLKMVQSDPPAKFEADAAKNLYGAWQGKDLTPEARAEFRSTMNTALHQTADAIAKRAFLMHLDEMSDADKKKGLLVTVGGCGAGKGFALKTLAGQGFTDFNGKLYGAIWDSAGDQNATENPWLLAEAEKRGIPVTYAYISADPEVSWADPERGVVQRAENLKDGRMVDAKVFADSYVLGARNHAAFAKENASRARFVFVKNGAKIEKLDGVPESDLARDRRKLHDFAVKTILDRPKVSPRIKRGALVGQRIWPMGRHRRRASQPSSNA